MNTQDLVWVGLVMEMEGSIVLEHETLPLGGLCAGRLSLRLANSENSKVRSFHFAEQIVPFTHPAIMQVVIREADRDVITITSKEIPALDTEKIAGEERVILGVVIKHVIALITHMEREMKQEVRDCLESSRGIVFPWTQSTKGDYSTRLRCTQELAQQLREHFLPPISR